MASYTGRAATDSHQKESLDIDQVLEKPPRTSSDLISGFSRVARNVDFEVKITTIVVVSFRLTPVFEN